MIYVLRRPSLTQSQGRTRSEQRSSETNANAAFIQHLYSKQEAGVKVLMTERCHQTGTSTSDDHANEETINRSIRHA